MQALSQIIASLFLLAIPFAVFAVARRRALQSSAERTKLLIGGVGGIAAGLLCILVFPRMLPETPGSPGTLVGVALLWVMGSVFMIFAVPTVIGAASGRPPAEGPR